ncbi:MAG: LolA family protein [Actinomycetota bacterium]
MRTPEILRRSRRARWTVPLGLAVTALAAVTVAPVVAGASPTLPPRTAAELLAGLASATPQPFSGTVVQTADLGLPALPSAQGNPSLGSLVTGSHTLRVWYAAPDRMRLALLDTLAETDVVRNGTDLWVWTSRTNSAEHRVLAPHTDAKGAPTPAPTPTGLPSTPAQATAQALAAIDPTTAVAVDGTATVAGRPAYELVLRPKDARSRIGQVRLAVDAATSMPLRVQVFARGGTRPAFDTGFTAVRFAAPADSVFRFAPPPGATVREVPGAPGGTATRPGTAPTPHPPGAPSADGPRPAGTGAGSPTVVGSGWTAVLVLRGVRAGAPTGAGGATGAQLAALLQAATPVSGAYGSGRLLTTPLGSALLLDDGRLLVGAVDPDLLMAAATDPAAR